MLVRLYDISLVFFRFLSLCIATPTPKKKSCMGINLHKLKTVVSADQNFRGSCFMSQNASACDLLPSSNYSVPSKKNILTSPY